MIFGQAIPLHLRQRFSEGSALASTRDSRNVSQSWKKSQIMAKQENANALAIQKVSKAVAQAKRRIVGAGSIKAFELSIFQITEISIADYFVAQKWNGTELDGVDVYIAKQFNFATSLTSEVVDGVTITHTYSDDNNRTSDDGVNSQNEICWPRFAVGNEIQAAQSSNGTPVLDADNNVIEWLDLTGRGWIAY